jgi:hypothetical protein
VRSTEFSEERVSHNGGRRAGGTMEEPADTTLQTAIAAVAGYFAVAVGLTAVFPVVGGCVPTPRGVVTTFSTFSEAKAPMKAFSSRPAI